MAKGFGTFGGVWFGLFASPLAAAFLLNFWIAPFLGLATITNIQQVLAFASPASTLIFLGLWLGIALGFIGGTTLYQRRKGR
ncbi:MAG TPA: hypothetical protein VFV92_07395 [Candidatus Bathyarchaeia archaeon]|nr:hypothetical protein [Candidatus Bathyarchaeia archaeon]